jgi:hypothetical protein
MLESPMSPRTAQVTTQGRLPTHLRRAAPAHLHPHRIATLERGRVGRRDPATGADGPPAPRDGLDPFDEEGWAGALTWLRIGIDGGLDPDALRVEIAASLWPWAHRFADRAARRLPCQIDPADIHSKVATALWACCTRLDPEPAPAWRGWLTVRLRGAVLDAARSSDRLSRRDRRSVIDGTASDRLEQVGAHAKPIEAAARLSDPGDDPCAVALDRMVAAAVHDWIRDDLPPSLADRLSAWWQSTGATTSLPASLAKEVEPYRFRLLPALELLR